MEFRAKRLDDGNWIYGYYMSRIIGQKILHYITKKDVYDWIPVKEDSVTRDTGLLDRKGNKIYEGDVSKNYYKGEWVELVVVWNPLGMWSVKWKDGYVNGYHLQNQNMEIIGNIYDRKG